MEQFFAAAAFESGLFELARGSQSIPLKGLMKQILKQLSGEMGIGINLPYKEYLN